MEIEDIAQNVFGFDLLHHQVYPLAFERFLEIVQVDTRCQLRYLPQHRLGIDLDLLEMLLGKRAAIEVQTVHLIEREPEAKSCQTAELMTDLIVLIGDRRVAEFEDQILRQ